MFGSVPKAGHSFANAKPQEQPTAAGGAVKADRSPEDFRGEERLAQHEPPDRCFLHARLAVAVAFLDFDGLQLQYP